MLTVLITTYNGAPTLPEVLAAYGRLVPPVGGWKLIVVDNGSTDATPEILESFRARLPLQVLHQVQRGQNAARNTGLPHLDGDLASSATTTRSRRRNGSRRSAPPPTRTAISPSSPGRSSALVVAATALAPRLGAAQPDVCGPAADGGGSRAGAARVRSERDSAAKRLRRRPPLRRDHRPQGSGLSHGGRDRIPDSPGRGGRTGLALRGSGGPSHRARVPDERGVGARAGAALRARPVPPHVAELDDGAGAHTWPSAPSDLAVARQHVLVAHALVRGGQTRRSRRGGSSASCRARWPRRGR
jgi:hypothetical protein